MTDPHDELRNAVSSLRTIGTVFLILGTLGGFALSHDGIRTTTDVATAVSVMVLWVFPGTLYHLTAVLLRKRDARIALVARRTAVVQCLLAVLALVVSWAAGAFARNGRPIAPLLPATVTIFFSPALLMQAFQIGRAVNAVRLLPAQGHAFEVQPTPVVPIDDVDPPRHS